MKTGNPAPKRALLSVSDKEGIVEFAKRLVATGYSILSTGGTANLLTQNGLDITEVATHTGFPEIMGGRVKTLHPKIHGGILGRRGQDDEIMHTHEIDPIDVVVVNLYPFEHAVSDPACTKDHAIENIDIGGPAMVRAAAKNHASVVIVTDPADYHQVLEALESPAGCTDEMKFSLAIKAFEHTSRYDGMIANYFGSRLTQDNVDEFPRTLNLQLKKFSDLRYGENPHQSAAFYTEIPEPLSGCVSSAKQLQGKELSYNNIADTDAALECVKQFAHPACVIVKHANPCGVAESFVENEESLLTTYDFAYKTDPTSAFGGIIAFNRELNETTAVAITDRQFVEVIIAPSISMGAMNVLKQKSNVRVLACGDTTAVDSGHHFARVVGGLLVQQRDLALFNEADFKVVTKRKPTASELADARFSWKVAKFVKSNAIVYCRNKRTIGVGAGQMSRVYSAKIAGIKAADEQLDVAGAVMASDAFFPFRDGIDAAADAGIEVVIQPGGSKNDADVIQAADEHGMAMVFTGMRHFRH